MTFNSVRPRKSRSSGRALFRPCLIAFSLCLIAGVGTLGSAPAQAAVRHASTASSAEARAAKPMFTPTGYFYVAHKKGRWWLVTPQGAPFYASGVDDVSPDGSGTDQVTGVCPYCQTVQADYASTAAWGTATLARLRSWGFNTLGAFSDNADLGSQMPYEVQLTMASGDDWFAPSFVTNADNVAAQDVAPLADDPNLIGYFTDSELNWGVPEGSEDPLTEYLSLPAGSPGLAVAQQYVGNPQGFIYALATRYFQVTTAAIRMYDPHHLILGVKAEGQEIPAALLEAAKPYVDVFSIEDYQLQPELAQIVDAEWPQYLPVEPNLANMYKYVDRPFMIGEYTEITPSPTTPSTTPSVYLHSPTQQARAQNYENFIAPLYEKAPWLVGDDWFQYVDEPQNGRTGDGENDNFGIVNVDDQPYSLLAADMQFMHTMTAQSRISGSSATCDSWSNQGGIVSCTSTMTNTPSYPLTIVTTSLQTGQVGKRYNNDVFENYVYAAGGDPGSSFGKPAYRYSISGGALPSGLKIVSDSGQIVGKPKQAGDFSFTVSVTDPLGNQATQQLSIDVVPAASG